MSAGPGISVLPQLIEPRKFAQKRVDMEGALNAQLLIRLEGDGERILNAQAKLSFDKDEQSRTAVTGKIDAVVQRRCQRCLETLELPVNCTVHWVVVWDHDQAKQLQDAEPWIVGEESADLYEAIEEEILLALPYVVFHQEQCIPASSLSSGEEPIAEDEGASKSPFAELAVLKQKSSKEDDQ